MYIIPVDLTASKLHLTLVKQIQRGVHYCRFRKATKHATCDNPIAWSPDMFNKWQPSGYSAYITSSNYAALISWNKKPHDVAKYHILKTDALYQDWRMKMKR